MARERAALTEDERQRLLLEDLVRALGPDAAEAIKVQEAVWVNDRWCGGGYNAHVALGHPPDAARQLADWKGPVAFAAAELDDAFAGYVEGAIRSGRRAAARVIADLRERV